MKITKCFLPVIVFFLSGFLLSCEDPVFLEHPGDKTTGDDPNDYYDEFDKLISELFEKGFSMKLEEVYVLTDFKDYISPHQQNKVYESGRKVLGSGSQSIYNIPSFTYSDNYQKAVLANMEKGEIWKINKMNVEKETYQINQGRYGEGAWATKTYKWNTIDVVNSLDNKEFITTFNNSSYTQYSWTTVYGFAQIAGTNLKLQFFDFDGKKLGLITNSVVSLSRMYDTPLTSNQVKTEIQRGNYKIVMVDTNITAYKIGENFYVPTGIGDAYRYYGSTSANGMFNQMSTTNYVLVFKLL